MAVLGLILAVGFIMVGIGGNLQRFVDIPSILIVVGFTVGVVLLGKGSIGTMFSAVFGEAGKEDLEKAARGWALAKTGAMAAGWLGILIGGVIMLANNGSGLDSWLAGGAILILTLFWGALLGYGIFLPLQCRLEERAREASSRRFPGATAASG